MNKIKDLLLFSFFGLVMISSCKYHNIWFFLLSSSGKIDKTKGTKCADSAFKNGKQLFVRADTNYKVFNNEIDKLTSGVSELKEDAKKDVKIYNQIHKHGRGSL